MARKTRIVQNIVQRWSQNGAASSQKYKDSINSLMDNPLDKAADAGALYLQKIQEAEAQGKRAAGLRAYGFDNWKKVTSTLGSVRLGQGMAQAQDRMTKAMTTLLPYIDSLVDQLPPRGDLNQNIARAEKFMRGMSQFSMNR